MMGGRKWSSDLVTYYMWCQVTGCLKVRVLLRWTLIIFTPQSYGSRSIFEWVDKIFSVLYYDFIVWNLGFWCLVSTRWSPHVRMTSITCHRLGVSFFWWNKAFFPLGFQMWTRPPRRRLRMCWSATTELCWSPIPDAASPKSSEVQALVPDTRNLTVNLVIKM